MKASPSLLQDPFARSRRSRQPGYTGVTRQSHHLYDLSLVVHVQKRLGLGSCLSLSPLSLRVDVDNARCRRVCFLTSSSASSSRSSLLHVNHRETLYVTLRYVTLRCCKLACREHLATRHSTLTTTTARYTLRVTTRYRQVEVDDVGGCGYCGCGLTSVCMKIYLSSRVELSTNQNLCPSSS